MESLNFAGQVHRWRLSELLQKGTERSFLTYQDDLALSLRLGGGRGLSLRLGGGMGLSLRLESHLEALTQVKLALEGSHSGKRGGMGFSLR